MTTKSHVLHILFVALTALASVAVEALSPGGPLAHFQWAAPAVGLLVYWVRAANLRDVPPGPGAVVALLIVALTAASVALVTDGCAHLPGPVPPADAGTVTDCSDAALHQAEISIEPDVANAVALGDYAGVEAAMASIVAQLTVTVGAPLALAEATCAVDWIVAEAEKLQTATADSLAAMKVANGRRWVVEHGANVKPAALQ